MQTILIVDDPRGATRFIRLRLGEQGFRTFSVTLGSDLLSHVRQVAPDLILLGLSPADLASGGVLDLLSREADTPVIVVSDGTDSTLTVRALDLGADDAVVAPFDVFVLGARIRALLRRWAASRGR